MHRIFFFFCIELTSDSAQRERVHSAQKPGVLPLEY